MGYPTLLFFGDSITQSGSSSRGFLQDLQSKYIRKADVVNRGLSGYNTRWALHALKYVISQQYVEISDVRLVIVCFGANDAALPDGISQRQFVPLQEFKRNLESLVQGLLDMKVPHLLLVTAPPLNEEGRQMFVGAGRPLDRENQVTGWYASACMEVASELGLPVLNLWKEIQRVKNWEHLLYDGLHLNDHGQRVLAKLLLLAIRDMLPQLAPENLPYVIPDHKIIDPSNPESAFEGLD